MNTKANARGTSGKSQMKTLAALILPLATVTLEPDQTGLHDYRWLATSPLQVIVVTSLSANAG
jgi:hypothetical protein